MSASQAGFERAWGSKPTKGTYRATVNAGGVLEGNAPAGPDTAHVYVIRLADRRMTTATGRDTNVLYIGQGGPGRVNALWSGQHSACKRLAWTQAAHRDDLTVFVEVQAADDAPLREVELLNAFLLEHGQMPALNSRHEGWLPARLLKALAAKLPSLQATDVYHGPRDRDLGRGACFTAIDLYDKTPPDGKPWSWRGTLLWVWPEAWQGEVNAGLSCGEVKPSAILLIGRPKTGEKDWLEVPPRLSGVRGWLGGGEARALVLTHAAGLGESKLESGSLKTVLDDCVTRLQSDLPTQPVTG